MYPLQSTKTEALVSRELGAQRAGQLLAGAEPGTEPGAVLWGKNLMFSKSYPGSPEKHSGGPSYRLAGQYH